MAETTAGPLAECKNCGGVIEKRDDQWAHEDKFISCYLGSTLPYAEPKGEKVAEPKGGTSTTKTIWKYRLEDQINHVKVPRGTRVLHVGTDDGDVHTPPDAALWALVDPSEPKELRSYQVVGTGWPLDESVLRGNYLGTAHVSGFVWHVFEIFPSRS